MVCKLNIWQWCYTAAKKGSSAVQQRYGLIRKSTEENKKDQGLRCLKMTRLREDTVTISNTQRTTSKRKGGTYTLCAGEIDRTKYKRSKLQR